MGYASAQAKKNARHALRGRLPVLNIRLMPRLKRLGTHALMAVLPTAVVWVSGSPSFGQSIIPAADGTATIVTQDGNRFVIDGGSLSGDGANLFHSFQQLGLSTNEIATFLSNPAIQNILGRVVGGNPSIIDGLLQVTGGDSNLFLMNPAGIVFGANARLDLSGSFGATTATGIDFAEGWFNAVEANDYASLTGNPTAFRFGVGEPGAIVNAGTLAVEPGQGVSLVGGTVINTGTIEAPGGQITVTAVPGTSRVRLQQPGWVVALEVDAALLAETGATAIAPWDLPRLLTEGAAGVETGLALAGDGSVELAQSGMTMPSGGVTAIVSGQVDVANVEPGQAGGEVAVLGERVGLVSADVDASGDGGGGKVLVGGDYQGNGTVPNAAETSVNIDSEIRADALRNGNGGQVVVWADGTAEIGGMFTARGGSFSGNGGLIETSGRQNLSLTAAVDAGAPNGFGGTWLIDPIDITIVEGGQGEIGSNTVDANLISNTLNQGTNVTIDTSVPEAIPNASGDIVQSIGADIIKISGRDATFRLNADDAIVLNGSIVSESGKLNVILNSDRDSSGDGPIFLDRVTIVSNDGDIILGGSANPLNSPAIGDDTSNNPPINEDESNFNIFDGSGIRIQGSVLNSGAGNISLRGSGGAAGSDNNGILITNDDNDTFDIDDDDRNSTIISGSGDIFLFGEGAGPSSGPDDGIRVENGSSISSNSGEIRMNGNSQTNSSSSGILLLNSNVKNQLGNIFLVGEGSNGTRILSSRISNASGEISIDGKGNFTGTVVSLSVLSNTSGAISVEGSSNNFVGIRIDSSDIETDSGAISVAGQTESQDQDDAAVLLISDEGVLLNFLSNTNSITITAQEGIEGGTGIFVDTFEDGLNLFTNAPLVLNANGIDIDIPIVGSDTLTIRPINPGIDITLGGTTNDNRLNLDTTDIENISDGFSQVIIGNSAGSSDISLSGNTSFDTPLILLTNSLSLSGFTLSTLDNPFSQTGSDTVSIVGPGTLATEGGITLEGNDIDIDPGLTLDTSSTVFFDPTLGLIGGAGGDINLTATTGAISTGDLDSSGLAGGNITLTAVTEISTGAITSNADPVFGGDGGEVFIDPLEDVEVSFVNAQGGPNGVGGAVDITAGQFFRATGSFVDQNGITASISTAGGQGSGPITLRHGGGLLGVPFTVGDASINGTAAAITSAADNVIAPFQEFPFSYRQGNISILTLDPNVFTPSEGLPDPPPEELGSTAEQLVNTLERDFTSQFVDYFDIREDLIVKSLGQIRQELAGIEAQTNGVVRPAIIYAFFVDPDVNLEELQRLVNQAEQSYSQSIPTNNDNSPSPESGNAPIDELRPEWEYSSEGRATEFSTIRPYLSSNDNESGLEDQLALLLVTGRSQPVLRIPEVTRQQLLLTVPYFNADLSKDSGDWDGWQRRARQLHEWLIAPLEGDLASQDITSLGFIMDTVLRSLPTAANLNPDPAAQDPDAPAHIPFRSSPIAVLQDSEGRYLIEKYSIGLIPSMSLIDIRYRDLREAPVLAMGTDEFVTLPDLPGVRSEIEYVDSTWPGKALVDEAFTVENLESESQNGFRVIHLATHAFFEEGAPSESYIQFSGQQQLTLKEIRSVLDLRNVTPSIDLIVLSACQTALGDREAELGFAGFAFQSGVRSALASLQSVSDEGTVGLITQFYQQLSEQPTKVEALRQAQLSLINGDVYIENGDLVWQGPRPGRLPMYGSLPSPERQYLDHPYYWAWFTIVGSPW